MKDLFYSCLALLALLAWAWAAGGERGSVAVCRHPGGMVATIGNVILCLVELLRSPRLGGLVERIPRRWRIVVPMGLSGGAGIVWRLVHGAQSSQEALSIGVFAGATAVFAHEAVVEALLGHARRRAECVTPQIPVAIVMGHRWP